MLPTNGKIIYCKSVYEWLSFFCFSIEIYFRYGDGYILVSFEAGYFTAISTHIKEVGQELFQVKNHKDCLTDLAISQVIGKIATCGDNIIKIHSLQSLEETEKVITVSGETGISKVEWSMDGTMLAAVTYSGNVIVYLIQIPKLFSVCGNKIALLTSLTEVAIHLYTLDKVNSKYKTEDAKYKKLQGKL